MLLKKHPEQNSQSHHYVRSGEKKQKGVRIIMYKIAYGNWCVYFGDFQLYIFPFSLQIVSWLGLTTY